MSKRNKSIVRAKGTGITKEPMRVRATPKPTITAATVAKLQKELAAKQAELENVLKVMATPSRQVAITLNGEAVTLTEGQSKKAADGEVHFSKWNFETKIGGKKAFGSVYWEN